PPRPPGEGRYHGPDTGLSARAGIARQKLRPARAAGAEGALDHVRSHAGILVDGGGVVGQEVRVVVEARTRGGTVLVERVARQGVVSQKVAKGVVVLGSRQPPQPGVGRRRPGAGGGSGHASRSARFADDPGGLAARRFTLCISYAAGTRRD